MMNIKLHEWNVLRAVARQGLLGLVCTLILAGCATQSVSDSTSGSRVEVYGEIDVGYGHSRTKTTVKGK